MKRIWIRKLLLSQGKKTEQGRKELHPNAGQGGQQTDAESKVKWKDMKPGTTLEQDVSVCEEVLS